MLIKNGTRRVEHYLEPFCRVHAEATSMTLSDSVKMRSYLLWLVQAPNASIRSYRIWELAVRSKSSQLTASMKIVKLIHKLSITSSIYCQWILSTSLLVMRLRRCCVRSHWIAGPTSSSIELIISQCEYRGTCGLVNIGRMIWCRLQPWLRICSCLPNDRKRTTWL